jgi:hypothetical protein
LPPQAAPYPQPPAYPPGQAYPPQQPYGAQAYAAPYPMAKPTSGLAIAARVCAGVGFVTGGLGWLPGIILGVLAMKPTRAGGTHAGRGMALAGLIISSIMTVLGVALVAFVVLVAQSTASEIQTMGHYTTDGNLIVERADMYRREHGDLSSGGHCFVGGYKNEAKAAGGLRVEHLAGANELKLPIDRYTLEVGTDGASVWYQEPGEEKRLAGRYRISNYGGGNFDFDDWDAPPPPPRKR